MYVHRCILGTYEVELVCLKLTPNCARMAMRILSYFTTYYVLRIYLRWKLSKILFDTITLVISYMAFVRIRC